MSTGHQLAEGVKEPRNEGRSIRIFGVDYQHLEIPDEGDLFVTDYGAPFMRHLHPGNWNDGEYYQRPENKHLRVPLPGSVQPFRITSQPVDGRTIDIVVKWCRVGQEVGIWKTEKANFVSDEELDRARWNGPFEEFGLLMELRRTNRYCRRKLRTQVPLAIFSPSAREKIWQTGRRPLQMEMHNRLMRACQREDPAEEAIQLDIHRLYALIYQWVKGVDAAEAFAKLPLDPAKLALLTRRVYHNDLEGRGYRVTDTKPAHFIVRIRNGDILRDREGKEIYSLIDFELLQRTEDCEQRQQLAQRMRYWNLLERKDENHALLRSDLAKMQIFGVNYICGQSAAGGQLWEVGNQPELRDYHDASKWRNTARVRLSATTFRTKTPDNIFLIYRESRCGIKPRDDPSTRQGRLIWKFGYNSPFEEIAIAEALRKSGLPTVHPRAIYRTDHESLPAEWLIDNSRYESHREIRTPDGEAVLQERYDYYTVWGHWRGVEPLGIKGGKSLFGLLDVGQALAGGLIGDAEYDEIIGLTGARLTAIGFRESIRADRLVLTLSDDKLARDERGRVRVTISINSSRALENGLLSLKEFRKLEAVMRRKLVARGYRALKLYGVHLLLSMNPDGVWMRDEAGDSLVALCNFELMQAPWMKPGRG